MAGITILGSDCASDDTSINVVDVSQLSENELLLIDDEIVIATAFPGEGQVDITRAVDQTEAAAHLTGVDVYPVVHVAHGGAGITVYYKDSDGSVKARTIVTVAPAIGNVRVLGEPSGAGESLVSLSDTEAGWAPGGGSMPVKAVDLGVIDVASVFADGPQTLYEMQDGEFLSTIRFTDLDFVAPDIGSLQFIPNAAYATLMIGTVKSFGWEGFANSLSGDAPFTDTLGLYGDYRVYGPDLGPLGHDAMVLSAAAGGPVQAAFGANTGAYPGTAWRWGAFAAWAPSQAYALATVYPAPDDGPQLAGIVANGTVWVNSGAAGVSGGSEPDFAGNAGGTVSDGPDIVWTDSTIAGPTVGAVHAVAEIWTPVAP